MTLKPINIAVDGYSSCGKSTLAKDLARSLQYIYIDSGAMYRAVTLYALDNGLVTDGEVDTDSLLAVLPSLKIGFEHNVATNRSETLLNGENVEESIRKMRVSEVVSKVSVIKEVRDKLVQVQKELSDQRGVVMDGRDIGTVVLPDAELKLFMTADPEVRARRRFDELQAKGQTLTMDEVRANLEKRDYIDTHREESPLRQAEDAIVIDNSDLTMKDQLRKAIQLVEETVANLA